MKNKGTLVVISGMTAVGKGTVCKKLLETNNNLWSSISMTTRKIRVGEIDSKDYFFISKEEFAEKIENNDFLEYATVHNDNYYGTPKGNVFEKLKEGFDVLLEIDIQGALQVKELLPEAIFIFIMPPNIRTLKKRLINRGTENEDEMLERFRSTYNELNAVTKYNYVVINDEIDKAANRIGSIIEAEKCRVDRIEETFLNTYEEEIHELLSDKDFINE